MKDRLCKALMAVLILSLAFVGIAYAEEDAPQHRLRANGEITWVDLRSNAFGLQAGQGEEYRFSVDRSTHFRSSDGSVEELSDLRVGMIARIIGIQGEEGPIARVVVIAKRDPDSNRIRVIGEITALASASGSFSLEKRNGEIVTFHTDARTRFRSRDGSISGIDDLELGMMVLAIGIEQEDGQLLARMVAAAHEEDLPDNLSLHRGEITDVLAGQGTFTLQTREGASVTFQTSYRTRFRSRDGSVTGIHDLEKGMVVVVGALETEDGLMAVLVSVTRASTERSADVERRSEETDIRLSPIDP